MGGRCRCNYGITNSKIHKYSIHNVTAKMIIQGCSYVILEGSTAIKEEKESLPVNAQLKKRELIRSGKLKLDQNNNRYIFTDKFLDSCYLCVTSCHSLFAKSIFVHIFSTSS